MRDGFKALRTRQKRDRLRQRFKRIDACAVYVRRLVCVGKGNYKVFKAPPLCRNERGQNALHGADGAVERELAEHDYAVGFGAFELTARHQNCQSYGQVVMAALLFYVGGGEVDGYSVDGKVQAGIAYGRIYPLPALLYGGVGQADELVSRHSPVYVGFDLHGHPVQADERKTCNFS